MKKNLAYLAVSTFALFVLSCGPSEEELKEFDKKMEADSVKVDKEWEKELESGFAEETTDSSKTDSNKAAVKSADKN